MIIKSDIKIKWSNIIRDEILKKINHEKDKKKIAMKLMGTTFDIWKKTKEW